jgi:hypothetical protein
MWPEIGGRFTARAPARWHNECTGAQERLPHTSYVELKYWQALVLSLVYQGGVIHIVGLWSLYGRGFAAENLMAIARFGVAYLLAVVFVEPLVTLAALAIAKRLDRYAKTPIFYNRLHHPVN